MFNTVRKIPVLPVLKIGKKDARRNDAPDMPCVEDVGTPVYCDSGGSAIFLALRHSRVASGDEVIIPAYHCPTMADPVRSLGASVVFCSLHDDTSLDLESIRALLNERTRAILVPHFFGMIHDLTQIRNLCDEHRLVLIEDCAHTFFGECNEVPVGASGDYGIASTRKFFPGADGGCLVSSRHDLRDIEVSTLSSIGEMRAGLDVIEDAQSFGRLGVWGVVAGPLFSLKRRIRRVFSGQSGTHTSTPDSELSSAVVMPRAMSRVSRRLLESSDREDDIARRSRNYRQLHEALASIDGVKPLFESPDMIAAPYMFPLLVEEPRIYQEMRRRGLPVWRWDDSDSACPVSRNFATHLLQIPCHQSIEDDDLDTLVSAVADLARRAPAAVNHSS